MAGPLSEDLRLLSAVLALTPLQGFLSARRADTGRPAKDRAALATAFVAKAIMNLGTTRDLMSRLQVDEALRPEAAGCAAENTSRREHAETTQVNPAMPSQIAEPPEYQQQSGRDRERSGNDPLNRSDHTPNAPRKRGNAVATALLSKDVTNAPAATVPTIRNRAPAGATSLAKWAETRHGVGL